MGSTDKLAHGLLRYNRRYAHNKATQKARKELSAGLGDWLRRGSGGDARHVSTWIVACVVDGIVSQDISQHKYTKQCGFDRNGSLSADAYVCLCGHEDSEGYIVEDV